MSVEYDHLFKLIFVGDSAVGKSSILNRYTKDDFAPDFTSTIGVEFGLKNINRVKLQIWDTAGQERFRTVTAGYYRGCHGVLMVYDINNRASFDNLSMWHKDTIDKLRVDEAEVIFFLVGNKMDVDNGRKVPIAEAKAFAKKCNMNFFEVSAKTGQNIEKVFGKFCEKLIEFKLSHLGDHPIESVGLRRPDSVLNEPDDKNCCILV